MKKRKLCQICVLWILFLGTMYFTERSMWFEAFKNSKCEELFEDGDKAVIIGKLYEKETGLFYLEELWIKKEDNYVAADERLPVYLAEEAASQLPEIGRAVRVNGVIRTIPDVSNPGTFHQKLYYQKQNIHIKLQNAKIESVSGNSCCIKEKLWQLKQKIASRIITMTGEKYGGILCAMLLGEKLQVDEEVKEKFQKTGIGHLIAISGLHMSFLGNGLLEILKKLGIHKNIAMIGSICGLTFYLGLIGGGVSSERAYIMFLMQICAQLLGREYDGITALSVAAMISFIQNPLHLFASGFLLSYGAVAAIYIVAPKIEGSVGKKASVPIALQLVLIPVMLYSFSEICMYSIVWNLMAVPLAAVVLAAGMIGIIGNFPFAFEAAKLVLWFYEQGCNLVLRLPLSRVVIGKPEIGQIFWYFFFLAAAIYLGRNGKEKLRMSVSLLAASFVLWMPQQLSEGLEITMINVGQGDAFFIKESADVRILIDGGSSSISEVGKYQIEPFLKAEGVGTLDYVFVTHGDEDHINGIRELILRQEMGIKIQKLVLPNQQVWDESLSSLAYLATEQGITIHTMGQGEVLKAGNIKVTCLWPAEKWDTSGNEASMVLSVSYGKFDALFTGDLEKEGEEGLCQYMEERIKNNNGVKDYELLKVGHHGSKYSTNERLLRIACPDTAFVSAGEGNSYGHPHEEVLNRLANQSINLYNTKDGNAVKLCTDGEKYYILEP